MRSASKGAIWATATRTMKPLRPRNRIRATVAAARKPTTRASATVVNVTSRLLRRKSVKCGWLTALTKLSRVGMGMKTGT